MKQLIYALACIHLALISVVIFHGFDEYVHKGWWEKYLAVLCNVNYSVWRYGFFSPDVGVSTEVEIQVHEDGGHIIHYSTLDTFDFFTANRESLNRFYGFKRHTTNDPNFQDLSARSVATRLLNLHPHAWRVDYTMRSIRYPAMDAYRDRAPIETETFYRTTFVLR